MSNSSWDKAHPDLMRAYKRAWKKRNPEKVREQNRKDLRKVSPARKAAYDKRYRTKHPEKIHAQNLTYYQANKTKMNEASQAWAAAHPERRREVARNWAARNPETLAVNTHRRRARKAAAPVNDLTTAQWREIKEAYGHRCVYCGRKMARLSQDHIIPLSKGGSHTVSNVVPACLNCNRKKNAGPPPIPVQPLLLTVAQGGKLA